MSELKVDSIEARSITISHPDSPKKISLVAMSGGAGIWVSNKDGSSNHMISIYSIRDQTAIGISRKEVRHGYELALYVDEQTGDPVIQMIDDKGEIENFTIDDLRATKNKKV